MTDAANNSIVVPAKAGTHTARSRFWHGGRRLWLSLTPVVMGPCFRRDDVVKEIA
jgi:hypothetical protein